MTLFSGIDIAGADDLAKGIPAGTYPAVVFDVRTEVGSKANPDGNFLIIEYAVDGYEFPAREKKWIPTDAEVAAQPKEAKLARSFLKDRLLSLGVPPERLNAVGPENLIGIEVTITMRERNGYTNVSRVAVRDGSEASVTLPKATAPAEIATPVAPAANPWGAKQ